MIESKKEIAISFQQLVTAGNAEEAFQKYIAPGFVHHNPYFASDAESLKAGMEENAHQFPNKVFEIQHTLEDGDFVAVHSRLQLAPDKEDIAVVHIFRFEENSIVELWDVVQPIPVQMVNAKGMF